MAKRATPEERSDVLAKAHSRARKTYKTNLDRKRDISSEEKEIILDTLVALKIVGGYSNTQCAAIVGLSKGQVREIAQDEKFKERVLKVKGKLPEAALNLGKAYLVEGVQVLVEIMRTETDNKIRLSAVEALFDRFGLAKTTKTETTKVSEEENLGAPKSLVERARQAPPEIQEELAKLQDAFSDGVEAILTKGT